MEHPQEYDKLVQDPEGLVGSATEEILRWASPVMYLRRNVTCDTELRGQALKAGDKVSLWYVSANRDETVFEDPFRFNIERQPNEHVAFGGRAERRRSNRASRGLATTTLRAVIGDNQLDDVLSRREQTWTADQSS